MKYVIRMRLIRTGNHYYFKEFDGSDSAGRPVPRSVSPRYSERCTRFPSIKAACGVVKKLDHTKWKPVIIPV